jgi:hypothetical protein
MQTRDVRDEVAAFFTRFAAGRMTEDAFPAWWLSREFEVAPAEAIACASTGSHDHGLDGFHLDVKPGREPVLHLVQSKFSPSHKQVRDGIAGFKRTFERLATVLDRNGDLETTENTIWTRLRARLEGMADLGSLVLHCKVIHLADADEASLLAEAKAERSQFEDGAAAFLPDHRVRLSLTGPAAIGERPVAIVPGEKRRLAFDGVEASSGPTQLFIGLGKLADLVSLFEKMGDSLFEKNVRSFNFRAAERGPSRHLRDTLRDICVARRDEKLDPLHFTLFHNGITLHVTSAERDADGIVVRSPSVLNGCQTVKSAARFRNDRALREKIDPQAWADIRVPLRVVRSGNDELVRRVTVSNNRQTAIRPSGFRANDPIQIALGERFRQVGIFYERQESAFENLKRSSPKTLEDQYPKSFDGPLEMEELAQAIALVAVEPALSVASKVSDLFESPLYERLFSPERLESLELLVFTTNLLRCVHLALKDTKEKSRKLAPMIASSFRYLATRVLIRWIVKNQPEVASEFGTEVIVRAGTQSPFRDRLRRLLSAHNSQLQTLIPQFWDTGEERWPSATEKELVQKVLKKLRIDEYDVFSKYPAST